jgi:putative nucleotidyltransferase with HDIG domain
MNVETALRTNERIDELVDDLDSIITLPQVASRIIMTVNDPNSTPADLHRIVAHDPALVVEILKLVNSSYYSLTKQIDSVERAIILLGFAAVKNLALSATFGKLFQNINLSDHFGARDVWMHCAAVAAAAREMARQYCKPLAEPAFLAGIVHDVGLLVELQVCPDRLRKVCELASAGEAPFSTLELDLIGCSHAELGAALATRWGFPDFCHAAAAYHHHPSLADAEHRQLVALIYTADTLCCDDAIGFDLTAKGQLTDVAAGNDLVPPRVIEYARVNLPNLVGDATLALGI